MENFGSVKDNAEAMRRKAADREEIFAKGTSDTGLSARV